MSVVPSSFSYAFPGINMVTSGNSESFQSYTPSSGQVFRSDATSVININVASPNAFARFMRSYLKGKVVAYDASGAVLADATTRLTSLGLAAVIQRMVISVGACQVESIDQYPSLLSLIYNLAPVSRKKLLTYLEGYQPTGALNTLASGKATFCHGIQSSLFTSSQLCPLPLIQNGVSIQIYLSPANQVFTTANVAYYKLEEVSFNVQLVTPTPDLLMKFMSGLDQGKSLYIPICQANSFVNYGSGGTQQNIQLAVGNKRSIQSFAMTFRAEADMSDVTKDKNQIYSSQNLRDVQIQIAGKVDPVVKPWKYNPTSTDFDPEVVALSILSADSIYTADQSIDMDLTNYDSKQFSLRYNFKSSDESFGDGISTELGNGSLTVVTNHSAAVPATIRVNTFVFVDSVIEIRKDQIVVNYVW